jgi:predicted metal-dependent hydrolase
MSEIKTIEIRGIGLVALERSNRAKRLSITIKPFRGIRVAVPYRSSFKKAEEFAYSHGAWIRKHLKRVKQYEAKYKENAGKVDNIDREKAKTIMVNRLRYLANKYGYSYNRVFIRNQKTRWGSCSAKNNISLNMKLVMLPDELIDYVILHELVHTRKKNHSDKFWREVDKLVDNSKQLRSRLRQYGMELY